MTETKKPGLLERFSYFSRNVEMVVAGIAVIVGNYVVAFWASAGAAVDHWFGTNLKNRRLKSTV